VARITRHRGRKVSHHFHRLVLRIYSLAFSAVELAWDMNQQYCIVALLTVVGFLTGMIAAHVLRSSSWLDAQLLVTLCSGVGFVAGQLLTKKRK
jgi:hypothetical protein